ncbi:MAG: PHB depolymerase family esterase [Nevskia sp.]|nr:PHB depolymerase family esterase [Nevskia sp.]
MVLGATPALAGDGSGLMQGFSQGIAALQQSSQQTAAAMQQIQQQTQAAFAAAGQQTGTALDASLQQGIGGMALALDQASPGYVDATPQTTTVSGSITWQKQQRTYILIRPLRALPGAPALLILHAHGMNSAGMANLVRAGRLAEQYGVWVYLPQGKNGDWNEDPSSYNSTDDVGFLSALIDHAVAVDGVDRQRVYASGYSGGGFMAERLACQASDKLAGFVAVAATLRSSLQSICRPTHPMAVAFMDGTSDLLVPYGGEPTVDSAAVATAFWATQNHCAANQTETSVLPLVVNDGTSIARTEFTGCPADAAARLYTVNHGGHTWPGSAYSGYTFYVGRTTQNLDATIEIWDFESPFSL